MAWLESEDFAAVVSEARAGSSAAFEKLYQAYAGAVNGYARMQGMSDPEDCTSETFLSAFRTIGSFSGTEQEFRSWLFTIAHHRVVDTRRRASRRLRLVPVETEHLDGPADDDPEATVVSASTTANVRALCERLVPDQRDVLLMRLVGGLTIDEIATNLGKTTGAVKALQRRGLAALKKILDEGVPL